MNNYLKLLAITCGVAIASAVDASAKTVEYTLEINRETVHITGEPLEKITVNGTIPGPTLVFTEGDDAVIHVKNNMDEDTSVHWHGLLLPGLMDGVPGMNGYEGIKPGETFTYTFPIRQSGTYWYHAHSKGQEQDGHYGSMVIHPKGQEPAPAERDYVVLLSDFHKDDHNVIMRHLKMSAEYFQYARRTVGDFFRDVGEQGWSKAWSNAKAWSQMRMLPTDLADVTGYTFLVNGKTNEQNWTGVFNKGERVKLRFINASAMSFFDVRIPGLKMTVVAADGQYIEPIEVDEFRFGVAETYDVIVTPTEDKAYTIAAESIDRTGFALGTLAPKEGMVGAAPKARERALLTMADMGHDMDGMDHDMGAMNHDMSGMDHSAMGHGAMMDHSQMNHGDMMGMMSERTDYDTGVPGSGWAKTNAPEGTHALAYKDLRYLGVQNDTRPAERTIEVRLGGNMERYIWTLNGKDYSEAEPIQLEYGERVRLKFVNETMMAHPMHLHGMFVQLENGQPAEKLPNKHTVIVAPGDTYSVLLTADEAGEWAFHCHLLYHMMSGMMNKVVVAKLEGEKPVDHSTMDHSKMDHSKMNHSEMNMDMDMDMDTMSHEGGHHHAH